MKEFVVYIHECIINVLNLIFNECYEGFINYNLHINNSVGIDLCKTVLIMWIYFLIIHLKSDC